MTWNPPPPAAGGGGGGGGVQFYAALGDLKFSPTLGGAQPNRGFKIFYTFVGTTAFSLLGGWRESLPHWPKATHPSHQEKSPQQTPPTNFLFPHQSFIPPNPLNSIFLLKIYFSEQYHGIRKALIYKVNCNLKLLLKSMKLTCFIYLSITEKGISQPLFIFVLSTEKNEIIK